MKVWDGRCKEQCGGVLAVGGPPLPPPKDRSPQKWCLFNNFQMQNVDKMIVICIRQVLAGTRCHVTPGGLGSISRTGCRDTSKRGAAFQS